MTTENQVRRLLAWNRFVLGVLLVVIIGVGGFIWLGHYADKLTHTLEVKWTDDGGVHLSAPSDGPFVVTHLSLVAISSGNKATAPLSPPVAVVDSHGATLSKSEYDKLKWRDYLGNPILSPAAGTPIVAFYSRPSISKSSKE